MSDYHIPVLARESIDLLNINPNGTYVDLTFGGGGHSAAILAQLGDKGRLFSFDRDADAARNADNIGDDRLTFVPSDFRFVRGQLRSRGLGADDSVDGVFADLGVSSHHFDTPERGFSFRFEDAVLDMRMNQRGGISARDVVNNYPREQLIDILRRWGEVEHPHKAANCIERARTNAPIETVSGLVAAIEPCTPRKDASKYLSKVFQALRIEVNGEMEALQMMLEQSLRLLKPGGRLVVISYHSLEDRLVKNFLRSGNFRGEADKDFYGNIKTPFEVVTRKAVVPTDEEIAANPRARSAKLRAGEKKGE